MYIKPIRYNEKNHFRLSLEHKDVFDIFNITLEYLKLLLSDMIWGPDALQQFLRVLFSYVLLGRGFSSTAV